MVVHASPRNRKPSVAEQSFEAVQDRIRRRKQGLSESVTTQQFYRYRGNPIAFIETELLDAQGKPERVPPDGKRLAQAFVNDPVSLARSANGVGKTWLAARLCIWFYLVWEDAKVFTAAAPPLDNLVNLLWGEIGGIVRRNPRLFRGHKVSLPSLRIERHSESFITGVTIPVSSDAKAIEARFSGKHAPHMAFFLDEADAIPAAVFRGIESCMSGGYYRLLGMFNPRQKAGETYLMEKEERARVVTLNAFNHPNVWSGKDVYPGAVDQATTLRRINLWSTPVPGSKRPDAECFAVPDYLVGKSGVSLGGKVFPPLQPGWRRVTHSEFWYMVMARYPSMAENQLISEAWIDAAIARWEAWAVTHGAKPPGAVRPISGLDVGELGTDESVLTHRFGGWVAPQQDWQGVDPDITGRRAAQGCLNVNSFGCNVDANGVGAAVPAVMRRHYGFRKAHRIMVSSSAPEEEQPKEDEIQAALVRDLMLWKLREWLRTDPGAMLPPSPRWKEQMLVLTYKPNNQGKIKITDSETIREKIKRSPDHLMSLALTFAPRPKKGAGEFLIEEYA